MHRTSLLRALLLSTAVLPAALGSNACTPTSSPPAPAAQSEARALSSAPAPVPAAPSAPAPSTASPPPAALAAGAARLSFDVLASYPATLLYALDRASSIRGYDARYRQWLLGSAEAAVPPWLEAYASRRADFRQSRDDGDGSYEPYAACSYGASTLDALLECASRLLRPSNLELARAALLQADALLGQRWAELEPRLSKWKRELQVLVSGPEGVELARLLANAALLPDARQLVFQVVLVGKPHGNESRATQQGSYLVVEVHDNRAASSQAHVLFHEIAHLAARHAPGRAALERAFVGRGRAGLVAANLWGEAFATAFGNGLAAQRLDPHFTPERSLYHDEAIDALGRTLYVRWRGGASVQLDASFAELMYQLVDAAWPPPRWRLSDLFGRVFMLADAKPAAAALTQGVHSWKLHLQVPVPAELTPPASFTPPVPRIVVAQLDTLLARADVLRLFGLGASDLRARLSAHGPSAYWIEDDAGMPLVLITAQTSDSLVQGARTFGASTRIPDRGWTALGKAHARRPMDPP